MDQQQAIAPRPVEPRQLRFADDGSTPNSVLPVLLHSRGHAQAVARIAQVALPELDPVLGKEGGDVALWC